MRHLVISILATSAFALSSQPATAGEIGAAIEVLHSTRGDTVVTPSYNWNAAGCNGFGFIDVFPDGGPLDYLTNHTVNCPVAGPVFVSTEAGATNFDANAKAGIGVNVPVPGMRFANVTAYPFVTGNDRPQVKVVWMSEDIRITDNVAVYTSGFARFRGDAPDVIQPQIWFRVEGSPVEFGTEIAVFGDDVAAFAAVKMTF